MLRAYGWLTFSLLWLRDLIVVNYFTGADDPGQFVMLMGATTGCAIAIIAMYTNPGRWAVMVGAIVATAFSLAIFIPPALLIAGQPLPISFLPPLFGIAGALIGHSLYKNQVAEATLKESQRSG